MLCMKTMGEIVREWRTKRGIRSRAALAELVGTTRQNIDNLENDRVNEPTAPYLRRLTKFMGYATMEDLLELKDPPLEAHLITALKDVPAGEPVEVTYLTPNEHRAVHQGTLTLEEAQSMSYLRPRLSPKAMTWGELKAMDDEGELPDTFEVTLEDDAMASEFPAGTVVKFRRGSDAKFGNRVLLKDGNGDLHFREFTQALGEDRWVGKATGRGFADLKPSEHGARVVAIKTGHYVEGS